MLREYPEGIKVCFNNGRIDSYMVTVNGYAIRDTEFLELFKSYGLPKLVWSAILEISVQINKNDKNLSIFKTPTVNLQITHRIDQGRLKVSEPILFDTYAACLIAEEQKENTKLGKKIKLLAAYQVLFEDYTPEKAASFSTGKKWKDLDNLCKERGF
ncbi:MAG: hypothetical protein RM049_23425 [Nostoc sp. DedQUE04]|uniref:DUF7004 family protein n=1 Tax=Nostoc sp. DedQUE04 TaxID=3075390 RepID=UPI002AD555E1|nr:hypothetical protein [Nostoc sp. DedQUE04]MDZ8138221.1 hypothetical protein [Nostoc sp. DedQUE04]